MTAPTLTLADFLLLRIAEDEAAAREAAEHAPGVGRWGVARDAWTAPHGKGGGPAYTGVREDVVAWHDGRAVPTWQTERHIARWDPARVLAECDSKRRIVEDMALALRFESLQSYELVLQYLALPYAGYPGYDEAWRP